MVKRWRPGCVLATLLPVSGVVALLMTFSADSVVGHAVEGRSLLKRVERSQSLRIDTDADLAALAASGRMPPELRTYFVRYGSRVQLVREGGRRTFLMREEAWPHREFSFDRTRDTVPLDSQAPSPSVAAP